MQRVLLLLMTSIATAIPGAAQELAIELRAARVTPASGAAQAGVSVAPSITWGGRSAAAAVGGELLLSSAGSTEGVGSFGFRLSTPDRGPTAGLALNGSAGGARGGALALALRAVPTLGFTGRGWSVSGGPHLGVRAVPRSVGGDGFDRFGPFFGSEAHTRLETAVVHGLVASARGSEGPVRLHGLLRGSRSGEVEWTDVEGEAVFEAKGFAFALQGGWRAGDVSERWASVEGAVRLTSGASLVGGVGQYVADPLSGRVPGTRAEIGIRVRTGRSSPAAATRPRPSHLLSDGRTRFVLKAEPGAKVELVGDWTGWRPTPVEEVSPGEYRILVRLPAGTHRFAFLVDGVWRLPEGFATEPNDYGDRHAVIRVAGR